MAYELKTEYYQGPIETLLELIEKKQLPITQISLAQVTGDFLDYLQKLEKTGIDPYLLADFLVVASKLILIKSKEILPFLSLTEEEEEELIRFEWGLKVYQELKKTHGFIKEKWQELPQMFNREFMKGISISFYPPKNVTLEELRLAISQIYQTLESFFKPQAILENKMINLKEKIEEVLKRITEKPISFQELSLVKSKNEIIVLFLAILHLIKEKIIQVEQKVNFGEIKIFKKI